MIFIECTGLDWKTNTQGKLTSKYHVKYAYSKDGKIAVDFKSETNIAKSFVICIKLGFHM